MADIDHLETAAQLVRPVPNQYDVTLLPDPPTASALALAQVHALMAIAEALRELIPAHPQAGPA